MEEINLRRRKKNNFYPKILIIVFSLILIVLIKATWNVFMKNIETKENLEETEDEYLSLKDRAENLESEIESLSSEKGIEKEIRSKFRVVKEDEGMILLIDPPKASSTDESLENKSLLSKFLDLLRF